MLAQITERKIKVFLKNIGKILLKTLKILAKTIFIIFALIGFVFVAGFLYLLFDEVGDCASNGKVWDEDNKICREDCLTWNKEFGCIKLNNEQIKKFNNCDSGPCLSDVDFKQICLSNQKVWDVDTKNCDFYFKPENCYKLNGNFEYPSICH